MMTFTEVLTVLQDWLGTNVQAGVITQIESGRFHHAATMAGTLTRASAWTTLTDNEVILLHVIASATPPRGGGLTLDPELFEGAEWDETGRTLFIYQAGLIVTIGPWSDA